MFAAGTVVLHPLGLRGVPWSWGLPWYFVHVFIAALLVFVNRSKAMLTLKPVFPWILRRALSWHEGFAKFQLLVLWIKLSVTFISSLFPGFIFLLQQRVKTQFSWPTVVPWWISVGLILASILSFCFLSRFAFCPPLVSQGTLLSWELDLLWTFLTSQAHAFWPVQLWTVRELELVRSKLLSVVQWKILIGFWFLCVGEMYFIVRDQ